MPALTREQALERIRSGQSMAGLDLRNIDLSYESMLRIDFSGADFTDSHLQN
jgi:uncharacterized protein YjbI with pentapeptide repeats